VADQPGQRLPTRLRVVQGDAQELDWAATLVSDEAGPAGDRHAAPTWTVVANLPYNIATPLILDLLEAQPTMVDWLVMVQREAGERLTAGPGSKSYGIPSVMVDYWAEAEIVASIGADVFLPRPNVESVLVRLRRRPEPPVDVDLDAFRRVVRAAFGQRRKMLRRSLAALVNDSTFERAGVEATDRPEDLDLDQWARLSNAIVSST
jgi:16S rRNA (adenine1518-N6/adenine1519-N6)-dimethyltransferase